MTHFELNNLQDIQKEITDNESVILYFYNDNCAPCLSLRPKIIELIETSFPLMKLIFINSINKEIPANYGVYDNPTLLVFFDRKEYIRESKYVSVVQLEKSIDRYYSLMFS
ncbi:MAG: thioredoxin family protein [Bacteroidales bacterium]|nr:thioredoxin family protein [Bacteroidales bacterium]